MKILILIIHGLLIQLMELKFDFNLPTWSNLIGLYYKKECIFSYANFPILKRLSLGQQIHVF